MFVCSKGLTVWVYAVWSTEDAGSTGSCAGSLTHAAIVYGNSAWPFDRHALISCILLEGTQRSGFYISADLRCLPNLATHSCPCADAVGDLDGLDGIEYPLGGTCVLFGVVLMVLLEHTAHILHAPQHGSGSSPLCSSGSGRDAPVQNTDGSAPCAPGAVAVPATSARAAAVSYQPQLNQQCDLEPVGGPKYSSSSSPAKAQQEVPADLEADVGHSHVCVSRGPASNWLSAANAAELVGGLRLRVVAYMFELGCIVHSVIIGVSLGINKTDRAQVRALLIALSFHQWLEVRVRGGG